MSTEEFDNNIDTYDKIWSGLLSPFAKSRTGYKDLRNGDVIVARDEDGSAPNEVLVGLSYKGGLLNYDEAGNVLPPIAYDEFVKIGHIDSWQDENVLKVIFKILKDTYGEFYEEVVYDEDWEANDFVAMEVKLPIPFHALTKSELADKLEALRTDGFSGASWRLRLF